MGPTPKYPWDKWLTAQRLVIKRGKDFHCAPYSMMLQIRYMAARVGKRPKIEINENVLTVTWKKPERKVVR
jgi:hypothetical protein